MPSPRQAAAPAVKPEAQLAPEQQAALTEQETREHAFEILSELLGLGGRAQGSPDGAVDLLKVCVLSWTPLECYGSELGLSLGQGRGWGRGQGQGQSPNASVRHRRQG